jgi:hypothetical protein
MSIPLRFPPPWSVIERDESFAVIDANGEALAYCHFEPDPSVMNRITRDEARRIADSIAKLPELLLAAGIGRG